MKEHEHCNKALEVIYAMKSGDVIIYAPPKGDGTTLTIEYKL